MAAASGSDERARAREGESTERGEAQERVRGGQEGAWRLRGAGQDEGGQAGGGGRTWPRSLACGHAAASGRGEEDDGGAAVVGWASWPGRLLGRPGGLPGRSR